MLIPIKTAKQTQVYGGNDAYFIVEHLEPRALLTLVGNALFPADNPWNHPITDAPVAANSATLITSIGATKPLHPDFGTTYQGANVGIPFNVVSGAQPKIHVQIDAYAGESDLLPVPIPANAVIEGDPLPSAQNTSDRHLIVYDQDNNIAYELFNTHRPSEEADGQWHADSEAVWQMSQDWFRTPGNTSADAAGLPILPGLVRPDEVLDQGVINHAIRFTVPRSANAYVFPASHQAGVSNTSLPRMGERFRLKQSFNISTYSAPDQVILQALKTYGMIVADNGSSWFMSGQPSTRWDDNDLHALTQALGSNFEAVDLTPTVSGLDQTSGAAGSDVTVHGLNFMGNAGQLQVFFGATAGSNIRIQSDNTLVVTAPAHANGVVAVTIATPYGTSVQSAADQFAFISPTVVNRAIFYNNSLYDGNDAGANATADNAAIAPDKSALLPGQTAAFANYTNYDKGLNGIIIDVANLPASGVTAADFSFAAGNTSTPGSWAVAPAPASVTVFRGAGVSGSDRIEIIWPDYSMRNQWLQVTMRANAATTGLATADTFYFGNLVGKTAATTSNAMVSIGDIVGVKFHSGQLATITSPYDLNRDGQVSIGDIVTVKFNSSHTLAFPFTPPAPQAPSITAAAKTTGVKRSAMSSASILPMFAPLPSWMTPAPVKKDPIWEFTAISESASSTPSRP